MIVLITGSRKLYLSIEPHFPCGATEIITGGAAGIDRQSKFLSKKNNIPYREVLPDYNIKNPRQAPILRDILMVDSADVVIAFWDGKSRGTKFTIDYAIRKNKPVKIYTPVADKWQILEL